MRNFTGNRIISFQLQNVILGSEIERFLRIG